MNPDFADLTTAHFADACLRLQVRPRCLTLQPVSDGQRLAGPARPVQHFGSVDVFLEAIDRADAGDVLVIDNAGRLDEDASATSLRSRLERRAAASSFGKASRYRRDSPDRIARI